MQQHRSWSLTKKCNRAFPHHRRRHRHRGHSSNRRAILTCFRVFMNHPHRSHLRRKLHAVASVQPGNLKRVTCRRHQHPRYNRLRSVARFGKLPSQSHAPGAMPSPPQTPHSSFTARTIIIGRCRIVVASSRVGASLNFKFITCTVAIGIRQAHAVAVVTCIGTISFTIACAFVAIPSPPQTPHSSFCKHVPSSSVAMQGCSCKPLHRYNHREVARTSSREIHFAVFHGRGATLAPLHVPQTTDIPRLTSLVVRYGQLGQQNTTIITRNSEWVGSRCGHVPASSSR